MSVVIPVGTALPKTGHLIIMSDITTPSHGRGRIIETLTTLKTHEVANLGGLISRCFCRQTSRLAVFGGGADTDPCFQPWRVLTPVEHRKPADRGGGKVKAAADRSPWPAEK
jgi:hypothetical protein